MGGWGGVRRCHVSAAHCPEITCQSNRVGRAATFSSYDCVLVQSEFQKVEMDNFISMVAVLAHATTLSCPCTMFDKIQLVADAPFSFCLWC